MEMKIVEAIFGLLSCACEPACQSICEQLKYIRKVKENEQNMRTSFDCLRSQAEDVNGTLKVGWLRDGKRPKEEVKNWLKNLAEIESDVQSLGSSDAHHMCFKGFCPNYFARWKRSKKTIKILLRVKTLQESGKPFAQRENLFIDSLLEASSMPVHALYGTSIERKKAEIFNCINNPEVSKIGIFGRGCWQNNHHEPYLQSAEGKERQV